MSTSKGIMAARSGGVRFDVRNTKALLTTNGTSPGSVRDFHSPRPVLFRNHTLTVLGDGRRAKRLALATRYSNFTPTAVAFRTMRRLADISLVGARGRCGSSREFAVCAARKHVRIPKDASFGVCSLDKDRVGPSEVLPTKICLIRDGKGSRGMLVGWSLRLVVVGVEGLFVTFLILNKADGVPYRTVARRVGSRTPRHRVYFGSK